MTRTHSPQQVSLLPPDAAILLHLVRENLRLLADLASRYETARLVASASDHVVRGPGDVVAYLGTELAGMAQEQLRVVLLDTKHHILGTSLVYQGGSNAVIIRLSDCFRDAVACGAAAVIFVHNHPSGDPTPSPEDIRLTEDAAHAGQLLGIGLLDHIIIGGQKWISLRRSGCYTPSERQPNTSATAAVAPSTTSKED